MEDAKYAGHSRIRERALPTVLPWLVLVLGIPASFFLFTLIQNFVGKRTVKAILLEQ